MSQKTDTKPKEEARKGLNPGFNKMLKEPKLSKCPKCGKNRLVTEPGMDGTKHCPDCGHWEGLKEWTKRHEART